MKIKKSVRYVCLGLIFSLLCGSVFFGSQSFAKYLEEYKNQQEAGVAVPIAQFFRGRVTRTEIDGDVYYYDMDEVNETNTFTNIQPEDVIDYYFHISNTDIKGNANEVLLKVTVSVRVYLRRMFETLQFDAYGEPLDVDADDKIYFIVGNEFLVGSNFEDQTDMKNANMLFLTSKENYVTESYYKFDNYEPMGRNTATDFSQLTNAQYIAGNAMVITGTGVGNNQPPYYHKTGFYLDPSSPTEYHKGYLVRITIPEQSDSDYSAFVDGRLTVEIDIDAEQVLDKN